jgi:OFA family oxalate/formate antiporter-like MFS transporter
LRGWRGKTIYSLFREKIFYGWWVAIAGLIISVIALGIRYSFGVFVTSIENEFSLTRGATSGIFSVSMLVCCVFAILGGWVLDRYGPRLIVFLMALFTGVSLILVSQTTAAWQLFISYGLILPLGTGPTFTVVNSTTSRWFEQKRGFILGLTTSGGGLGAIVMAPLSTYLIVQFEWRTAFIIIGLIACFIMASLALLLRKDPRDMGLLPDGIQSEAAYKSLHQRKDRTEPTGLSLSRALRTSNFWFLCLVWLLLSLNVHLIMVHLVPYAVDTGISAMDAAIIVSLIGGATIVGRIGIGKISDATGRKVPAVVCALLQVGMLLWLIWSRELWMLYIFAIVFGSSWGGLSTMVTVLIGDVFGMRSIGAIMGVMSAGWSLGAASGPAIGGFTFDVIGNYFTAFSLGAGAMLIATLLVVLIRGYK